MTAPIASGWSGCRMGFAPTGKRRLCTAHTQNGHQLWGGRDDRAGWRARIRNLLNLTRTVLCQLNIFMINTVGVISIDRIVRDGDWPAKAVNSETFVSYNKIFHHEPCANKDARECAIAHKISMRARDAARRHGPTCRHIGPGSRLAGHVQ